MSLQSERLKICDYLYFGEFSNFKQKIDLSGAICYHMTLRPTSDWLLLKA